MLHKEASQRSIVPFWRDYFLCGDGLTAKSGDRSVGTVTAEGNVPTRRDTLVMIHNVK